MRIRHLTDFEIQGMMDRRGRASVEDVPGAVYVKDIDAQEHLDSCPQCQTEMRFYRELYGELEETPAESLPKNFASDVTFSLPPFRAQRTRARLRMLAIAASAVVLMLGYLATLIDWTIVATNLVATGWSLWNLIAAIGGVIMSLVPLALLQLPGLIPAKPALLETIQQAFVSETGSVHFVFLAALALVMIASLDRLFMSGLLGSRSQD